MLSGELAAGVERPNRSGSQAVGGTLLGDVTLHVTDRFGIEEVRHGVASARLDVSLNVSGTKPSESALTRHDSAPSGSFR